MVTITTIRRVYPEADEVVAILDEEEEEEEELPEKTPNAVVCVAPQVTVVLVKDWTVIPPLSKACVVVL